jgi:germination protein YpeB
MKKMSIHWGGRIQKKGFIVMAVALAAALLVSSVVLQQRVSALTLQVNATYQKSFYETIELMNGIQLNIEKLTVTGSGSQEQALLTTIARQAESVASNLSQMPSSDTTLQGALKFVNQVSDIARVLSERIGAGGTLTQEDHKLLGSLHDTSVKLNEQLQDLLARYDAGKPVFGEGNVLLSAATNTQSPEDENNPAVDYPELLYDGPFSDARNKQDIKLSGQPVTQEAAAGMLTDFIGKERVKGVTFTGDSQIFSSCYEFAASLQDGNTLTAGVTKTGGLVVYMLPEMGNSDVKLTEGDCIDQGARFLAAHGYENMEVNYWRRLDGILTINYAATQGGVLLYPDLVKLQVSMKDGLVVGIEAVNYLTNHRARVILEPVITEADARSRANQSLTIERVRRCIIPLDEGEVQCWEVMASASGGERYLVYIDTATGVEKTILRVMEDDEGVVTQ